MSSAYVGLESLRRSLPRFVDSLTGDDPELCETKASLNQYLALQYHTGVTHADIAYLYPETRTLTLSDALFVLVLQLCKTMLHPRALLFLPVLIIHVPAYLTAWLGVRLFAVADEEESQAQFKAIFGGLGMGAAYGALVPPGIRLVARMCGSVRTVLTERYTWRVATFCEEGLVTRLVGTLLVAVGISRLLWRWHDGLVGGRSLVVVADQLLNVWTANLEQ